MDMKRLNDATTLGAFSLLGLGVLDILSTFAFLQNGHIEGNSMFRKFFDAGLIFEAMSLKFLIHFLVSTMLIMGSNLFMLSKKHSGLKLYYYVTLILVIMYMTVVSTNILVGVIFP